MTSSLPIKVCLIGAGKRAQKAYIPVLKDSNKYELTIVYDTNEKVFEQLTVDFPKTKMVNSVDTLLRNGALGVEFVIICVSHQFHYHLTKTLLEHDISVLKEKPFTTSFADALALKTHMNEKGKLGVVVQNRFDDYYLHCKKLRNRLGVVKAFYARSSKHIKQLDGDWRANKKEAGGGALIDIGYHMMDFLLMLFGEPSEITSNIINDSRPSQEYDCEDTIQMLFKWSPSSENKSAMSGIVEITRVGITEEFNVHVQGINGYLIISNQQASLYDIDSNLIETIHPHLSKNTVTEKIFDEFYSYISNTKPNVFENYLERDLLLMKIINSIYKYGTYSNNHKVDTAHYTWPRITTEMEKCVIKQLHTSISIYDRSGIIKDFEDEFKSFLKLPDAHAVLCNSGTMAIYLMFQSLDLNVGDEILVPVYTFHATVSPMMALGLKPIFCDCDENGNLDINEISRKITPNVKGLIVTHMWGAPANIKGIRAECDKFSIRLLEDCSHAHGASVGGQMVGTFGDAAVWSFQGQKILTGGEAGILVIPTDKDMYYRALLHGHYNKRCLQEIPKDHHLYKYSLTGGGFKLRVHPLSVAIVKQQLQHVDEILQTKKYFARKMSSALSVIPFLKMPPIDDIVQPAWYAFIIFYDSKLAPRELSRDKFVELLVANGLIEVDIPRSTRLLNKEPLFVKPEILHKVYKSIEVNDQQQSVYLNAEKFYETTFKLPVWAYLDEEPTVDLYINTILKVSTNFGVTNTNSF